MPEYAVAEGLQAGDRRVFEQVHAVLDAGPAQLANHLRRVEQCVIGLVQTGAVQWRVQVGLECRSFQPGAVDAVASVLVLKRAQALDLPWGGGHVEFAGAFEFDLKA
ncbi:hypothetical protein D3C81_1840680 [compost metagenome]